MTADAEQDAMMGDVASPMRMLHARGMQINERLKAADKLVSYEGAPPSTLDKEYMAGRMNTYESKHSEELPLTEVSRPGPRSWGKLHHMLYKLRVLRHQALTEILNQQEEDRGEKRKVTRADPETGVSRTFEEWVEIRKDLSSPHILKKAMDLRTVLWEFEQLTSAREALLYHQKLMCKLEVTPASGHRAPTCEELLEAGRKIMSKVAELWNYKGMSFAAALLEVQKPEYEEPWLDLTQRVSIPDFVALARAAGMQVAPLGGGGGGGGGGGAGGGKGAGKRSAEQAALDARERNKAARTGRKTKAQKREEQFQRAQAAAVAAKSGSKPARGVPEWWGTVHWAVDGRNAQGKVTGCCHGFHAPKGCARRGQCTFLHSCPKLVRGKACSGSHPVSQCSN